MYFIKAGDTSTPIKFNLVLSSDQVTGVTGQTGGSVGQLIACSGGIAGNITVHTQVSTGGTTSAFALGNGSVAEAGFGTYDYYPAAGEVSSHGILTIDVQCATCQEQQTTVQVVSFDPNSATNLGLSALPTASPGSTNGLISLGVGAGQITPDGTTGSVPASGVRNAAGAVLNAPNHWNSAVISSTGYISIDTTQPLDTTVLPITNASSNTVGNALWGGLTGQGICKIVITGYNLNVYDITGNTLVRQFTLTPLPTSTSQRL